MKSENIRLQKLSIFSLLCEIKTTNFSAFLFLISMKRNKEEKKGAKLKNKYNSGISHESSEGGMQYKRRNKLHLVQTSGRNEVRDLRGK